MCAIIHKTFFIHSFSHTHIYAYIYIYILWTVNFMYKKLKNILLCLQTFARVGKKKKKERKKENVMMHVHLQAPAMIFSPHQHTHDTHTHTHTHTYTTTTTTSVPPSLQSLSTSAVLQGVNVKLSKLDETLWEILWGSLLVWWLGASG